MRPDLGRRDAEPHVGEGALHVLPRDAAVAIRRHLGDAARKAATEDVLVSILGPGRLGRLAQQLLMQFRQRAPVVLAKHGGHEAHCPWRDASRRSDGGRRPDLGGFEMRSTTAKPYFTPASVPASLPPVASPCHMPEEVSMYHCALGVRRGRGANRSTTMPARSTPPLPLRHALLLLRITAEVVGSCRQGGARIG